MATLATSKPDKRTVDTYRTALAVQSVSTQKIFQCVINNIKTFGKFDLENIDAYKEDDVYDMLQQWIVWNYRRGIASSSIRCYFNCIRSYLWYRGLRLDQKDIRYNLKFGQMLYPDVIPATHENIQKILDLSEPEFQLQLLALVSSGMRASELGCLKNTHVKNTDGNATVRIPAEITKTGRSRVTFFSKQVSDMLRERLYVKDSDYLFRGDRNVEQFTNLILKRFSSARKKAGLMGLYGHCKQNRYYMHVHVLRSYFITNLNKVMFGAGHILAGHDFYMKEYNQYAADELLAAYRQAEIRLTFE